MAMAAPGAYHLHWKLDVLAHRASHFDNDPCLITMIASVRADLQRLMPYQG